MAQQTRPVGRAIVVLVALGLLGIVVACICAAAFYFWRFGATALAAVPIESLPPYTVTELVDPFGGHTNDIWLLIVVDKSFSEADARTLGRFYDHKYSSARVFFALFLCDSTVANVGSLMNLPDDEFQPHELYEYLRFVKSSQYPEPVFRTTNDLINGGTACH